MPMTEANTSVYEFIFDCHLSARLECLLASEECLNLPSGRSMIKSRPLDPAGLHGLLAQVRDLNIPIVSIRMIPGRGEEEAR
jgi:hypothetical protein